MKNVNLRLKIIRSGKKFEFDNFEKLFKNDKFENSAAFLHNIFVLLKILLFSLDLSNICIRCHCYTTIFKWKYLFEYWILMRAILMCRSVLSSDLTCHQMIYKLPTIIPAVWPHSTLSVSRGSYQETRGSYQETRGMISRDTIHKCVLFLRHLIREQND